MRPLLDAEYVQLDRTFHDLSVDPTAGDDAEVRASLFNRKAIGWEQVFAEFRVVLLAEAGAGKTEEIRAVAHCLRERGCRAFFLRIEHLADHLEHAFEVGEFDEFEAWLSSAEEGWLLLDSVDEARLGSPKDFERAMRVLSKHLKLAMQRTHIVITGRNSAWRPKSDLNFCSSLFPFIDEEKSVDAEEIVPKKMRSTEQNVSGPFRILALDDLHGEQIRRFLVAKGFGDVPLFLDAVERADAWNFTTRPQDLEELANFWTNQKRIGSRLEIMRASIDRRLVERDPDRAEARPLSAERARQGARLVAAACTLSKQPLVSVPDAIEDQRALSVRKILAGWTEAECSALVSRPLFDEAIYGSVRFHHRSVREYLTAEWLSSLLARHSSRRRIEGLFFRKQYGLPVIVPLFRPILPWLIILDGGILARVNRLAPEVFFEGGDPRQLPAETRRAVLRQVCEQLAQPAHGRSALDYAAVQRFAASDLATDISSLLNEYSGNDSIIWFLLRLVWHGEIKELCGEVKHFAFVAREKYARIAAIKALQTIGSPEDKLELQSTLLAESGILMREWLDEVVQGVLPDAAGMTWLTSALKKVEPKERFSHDTLSDTLCNYIETLNTEAMAPLVHGLSELLQQPPLIEKKNCRISERYQWLAKIVIRAVARLIEIRSGFALEHGTLSMLSKVLMANKYYPLDTEKDELVITEKIKGWPEFNYAFFWACVNEARLEFDDPRGCVTNHWHIGVFRVGWGFDGEDFDRIVADVGTKTFIDDRQIALGLAFSIYTQAGRPRRWRERMRKVAAEHADLAGALQLLLSPPKGIRTQWLAQNRKWKREQELRNSRKINQEEKDKEWLQSNLDAVRGSDKDGVATSAQYYLHQNMKRTQKSNTFWTTGNWESLVPQFGEAVAQAFRSGAIEHWRKWQPLLPHEGGSTRQMPFASILGLAGLAIESRETSGWAQRLLPEEAALSVRYALAELNGFPPWFFEVFKQFPDVVADMVIREIIFEVTGSREEHSSSGILHDIAWSGRWMWDRISRPLFDQIALLPLRAEDLGSVLTIIQGSAITNEELGSLALRAYNQSADPIHTATWFAVWVGVSPDRAIVAFENYLEGLPDEAARTNSVMVFSTKLLGSRRGGTAARQSFRTVQHLRRILILIHTYVRQVDDIERAGKGVYSPGLRDDAQDARDSLFSYLKEIPGKEAFLALNDLSINHPDGNSRPWMAFHAKIKAEQDADATPWTLPQFLEFADNLERTPSNHRELWELAYSRILDIKDDLERGDTSIASILLKVDAEEMLRNYLGGELRSRAVGRYTVSQEEELADAKRPDIRFHGAGFDAPVPLELKIADKWTGPTLMERFENQLCGDYLRDNRSNHGLFVLIYRGTRKSWEFPDGNIAKDFTMLIDALQRRWDVIADRYPYIEDVRVVGIDLEERRR